MDNQHKLIKGYRDLTKEEIDAINKIKSAAELHGELIAGIEKLPEVDKRWLAIARTDLQTGFMALTRAVARPTTF